MVGGVYGCFDELCGLLSGLGYEVNDTADWPRGREQ
jgi:hypothetical protein